MSLVAVGAQAGRSSVLGQIMAALGAEYVRDLHAAMAAPAHRSQLELALWAEVVAGRQAGRAIGAPRKNRLPQHEVDHGADPTWEHRAYQHPESLRHAATLDVPAHVAEQQGVTGHERAPRVAHHHAHGQHLVAMVWKYPVEEVLHGDEQDDGQYHRPARNHPQLIVTR